MVADWLRFEIASGLQKLLALRLIGTPPEDGPDRPRPDVSALTRWSEA